MIHGDSVYDIIDKQDHASIQSELMRGLQISTSSGSSSATNGGDSLSPNSSTDPGEKRIFLCRMNVSRNARRQMRFGDQKVGKDEWPLTVIWIISKSTRNLWR